MNTNNKQGCYMSEADNDMRQYCVRLLLWPIPNLISSWHVDATVRYQCRMSQPGPWLKETLHVLRLNFTEGHFSVLTTNQNWKEDGLGPETHLFSIEKTDEKGCFLMLPEITTNLTFETCCGYSLPFEPLRSNQTDPVVHGQHWSHICDKRRNISDRKNVALKVLTLIKITVNGGSVHSEVQKWINSTEQMPFTWTKVALNDKITGLLRLESHHG